MPTSRAKTLWLSQFYAYLHVLSKNKKSNFVSNLVYYIFFSILYSTIIFPSLLSLKHCFKQPYRFPLDGYTIISRSPNAEFFRFSICLKTNINIQVHKSLTHQSPRINSCKRSSSIFKPIYYNTQNLNQVSNQNSSVPRTHRFLGL